MRDHLRACCPLLFSWRCWLIAALILAYFVAFPEDSVRVAAPIETLLSLSKAISAWLYMLLAVALVCWTVWLIWGRTRSQE